MALSALEIKKKEFTQKMRGADPDEVQAFLDKISAEVETMMVKKQASEDRMTIVLEKLEHYTSLEQTIEKTLAAAQQTAVTITEQAKREAELILRDAELERSRKLNDARIEQNRLDTDILRLRSEHQALVARLRAAVEGFNSYLRSLEQENAMNLINNTISSSVNGSEAGSTILLHQSTE